MNRTQKAGLTCLVILCALGSYLDGIRILAVLSTLALASYIRDARRIDRSHPNHKS